MESGKKRLQGTHGFTSLLKEEPTFLWVFREWVSIPSPWRPSGFKHHTKSAKLILIGTSGGDAEGVYSTKPLEIL